MGPDAQGPLVEQLIETEQGGDRRPRDVDQSPDPLQMEDRRAEDGDHQAGQEQAQGPDPNGRVGNAATAVTIEIGTV